MWVLMSHFLGTHRVGGFNLQWIVFLSSFKPILSFCKSYKTNYIYFPYIMHLQIEEEKVLGKTGPGKYISCLVVSEIGQ